ncbi:hypothetical protein SAMN06265379_1191, partial [Saccharicrinis carchari]
MVSKTTLLKSLLLSSFLLSAIVVSAQSDGDYQFNYSRNASWDWNMAANWDVYNAGSWVEATNYPGEVAGAGTLFINDGDHIVLTADVPQAIGAITFADGTTTATDLTMGANNLTVSGAVTFGDPDHDAGDQNIFVNSGTLTSGSVVMVNTGNNNEDTRIDIDTGTLIVNGDITQANSNRNNIRFVGAATGELYIGGDYNGNGFTRGSSTVYYNSAGTQVVGNTSYHNVYFTGGIKTLRNTTYVYGAMTLGTVLDIENRQLGFIGSAICVPETSYGPSAMINISNNGSIRRDGSSAADFEMIYPIGIGTDYTPMELTSVSGSDLNGRLYIRLFEERHSLTGGSDNAISRYWDIRSTNTTLTSVIGSFTYADNDVLAPINESNLTTVGYFDGSDWQQNASGVSHNHATNQILFSGVPNLYGEWTLGESTGCFDALPSGKFTVRDGNWNTASTWNGGVVPKADGTENVTVYHNLNTLNADINVNNLTFGPDTYVNLYDQEVTVAGDLVVEGTVRDSHSDGTVSVGGTLTVNENGEYNIERSPLTVAGDVTVNGILRDAHANGTNQFNGNLTIGVSGTCNLDYGTNTINGTTTVNGILSDTRNEGSNTFAGKLTVNPGGSFSSADVENNFLNGLENNGSFTVSSSYVLNNDLIVTGSSELLFTDDLYIADNVTLTNQNTGGITVLDQLDGQGANAKLINEGLIKYGDNDRVPMNSGILDCATFPNTFEYNRNGRQYIKAGAYYNLVASNNSDKELQGVTTVLNDLTTSGTADFECQNHNLNIGGAIHHTSSGLFLTGINTVTYNGFGDQSIASNVTYAGNLAVDGTDVKSLSGATAVTGDINITGATLHLNGHTITPGGNVSISTGATIDVDDNASLELADVATLTNNGTLQVVGSPGNPATITTAGSGGYLINQSDAAAQFHALYGVFDATGGITVTDGSIDATNNFSHCTFSNGTGSEYLNFNGYDPIGGFTDIQNAVFTSGPTNNVTRTSGTHALSFVQATGALAGENYDNDNANPGTLIEWTDPSSIFYSTGNVSAHAAASWNSSKDGSGGSPDLARLSDGTLTLIVQDGHTVTLDSNGDINVRKLIVGEGTSGQFLIGGDATQQTLTVQELIEVNAGAILEPGSSGEPAHNLELYGNMINNGTVNLRKSFTQLVNTRVYGNMVFGGANIPVLSQLTFEAGSNATANVALDVNWNLILEAGATFNDGGHHHKVEYNWINNGGTYNATGGLDFDGGTSSIVASGTETTFNHVTFNGGGLVTIKEDVTINGNAISNNNTRISVDDVTVTVNGNFNVEPGSEYVQATNYTYFNGTDAQTITLAGSSSFNRVYFTNGGANAKTIVGDMHVNNWLMINNGATVNGTGDHLIERGLRVDGTCNFSGSITMKGGYIDTNDPTVTAFTLGTAKLNIENTVYLRHASTGTVTITMQNDVLVHGSGALVINDDAVLVGQPANSLTLEAGRNLYVRGADNFPDGFGSYNFDPTANVVYDADMAQIIRGGFTYGRLYVRYAHSKTVDGPITVTGHLYLRNGATLDLQNFAHLFSGSNIYNGTAHNGSIDGSNATLTMSGSDADQNIDASGSGAYTFRNLILSQNGATATRTTTFNTGCKLVVTDDLTIENVGGTEAIEFLVNLNDNPIAGPANNLTLGAHCWLYVDHLNFGSDVIDQFTTTSLDVNSTVYYSLNGVQNIADGVTYGNLGLYTGNKLAEGNLDIEGDMFNIGAPEFYDGGFVHTIAGNWKLNSTNYYTQRSATGTIVFDGTDQDVDGRIFNNLTIANSGKANLFNNLDVFGNLTVNDGSSFEASTLNMNIGGDMVVLGAGKYTQTTGTTTLNGDDNQSITMNAPSNFGNLTINKTNPVTQTVTALTDLNIGLDLTVEAMSGIFDISNRHVYIGDDLWIRHNTGVQNFITTGSTVVFNGSTAQEVRSYHEDNLVFNNLLFEGSGDKTLSYSNSGGGLLAAQNFEVNGNFTINGSVVEGNSISLYVRGNWTNNGTFNHGRTVYFDGADQTVGTSGFHHVSFQGSDTKTLTGNITVSYDVYIDGTATLNADGNNITLGRTWYNNVDGAGYVPGTGKVVFNGASGANVYTGTHAGSAAGKDFYAIDVNKTNSGYVSLQGDLIVQNDLNINSQIMHTYGNDVWVGGNFVVNGTYNCNNNASLLTLNASGGTHVFQPNGATLRGLEIDAPGATYQMQGDFILDNGDMTIKAGTLDLNKNQIQLNDYNRKIDIAGGSMIVGPASKVLFTNTQSINLTSGELHIAGEEGTTANMESTHASRGFTVNALGGTIFADHYRIQKGSIVVNGATLDATKNLSNGTFVEGAGGSSYITLTDVDLGAGISLSNMIFNSGASKNISRTAGNGTVTVLDASGSMAGAYYEEDNGVPGTLIDWTFPAGFFWDGNGSEANTNWHDALNWSGNTVPGANDIVYLDHSVLSGNYTVVVSTADAACMRVVMDSQGGSPLGLIVGAGRTLDVTEHVAIGAGTTLTQADNTAVINVGKNWTNLGTYTHNNAKVIFNATAGDYIISSGGTGAGKSFYDLTIDAGTSLYTLDMPTDVQNNLTVSSGTFDLASPNNDITVGGNWHIDQGNGGRFVSNKADVTFNGTLQSIKNGTFYNLIIGPTSTTSLSSNIAVENDITLSDGSTLNANDRNIYVRRHWQNNNGTFQQTGLGTVIFDKTGGTQYVDNGTHGTTFNHLTFSNSANKTFRNDVSVNGNVLINDASGVVNVDTYVLNGVGADNKFTCNEDLQIQGASNFPSGFETMEFSDASLVRYYADIDQNIYPATYGGIDLESLSNGAAPSVKTALGNIEITGSLYLNDINRPAILDMETNDANMVLTGSIDLRGASAINWGTGNATLEHIGGGWSIDADITGFNNLILSGTGAKYTQGDLVITGDLTIKSGVDFRMYHSSNRNDFKKVTGTPTGTISMETGARILNTRPSLAVDPVNGGPAIAEGFGTYDFNESSTYFLYSNGVDQTVYTGNAIAYGNLNFSSTKNVTGDGIADLDVNGDWNMNTATYFDGGTDMRIAGANVYFNNYVASSSDRKLVLDGLRDQRLLDGLDPLLELPATEFRGTGVKTIVDHTNINGNLFVDAGVTLTTRYNITFNGNSWINNGFYQQTGNGLTFNGAIDQTIDPGMLHADNYFNILVFDGAGTKTFVNNGADINNAFTINEGTVDLGSHDYYFANRIENILGGILLSGNANITLDGGNQNVNTPNFAADNITCSGNGTKYLYSDWNIGRDLTIESGVTLSTRTTADYNIYIGGDWNNQGTFRDYTGKVVFNGNLSPVTITSGGSNFYDVEFAPTAAVKYSLLSASTTIHNQMHIGDNAELDLNSQTLNLGRDNTGSISHTVNGTLTIDEGAFLRVNNDDVQSVLDVYGTLNIVGADESHVATLTSQTTPSRYNKTQVNIHPGATMAARYYLIEYISDTGLNLMAGSTLHPVNNFSDGTFLNMRDVAGSRYLTLESNYSGGNISNVSFSYDGIPVQGRHFNVQRKLTAPAIVFDNVTGSIGNYRYEDDDHAIPAFDDGLVRWPQITETQWTGAVDIDWHKAGNWDNGVPTSTMDAIIADKDNDPIIFADNAVCKGLIITDGTLRLEDERDIVVHDNVSVDQGVLFVNAAGSAIDVRGDWSINTQGNFVHGNGTVTFSSPNGFVNIAPGSSNFYNLVFNNAISTFNISASELNIEGDLDIYNGTVSPSTNNYTYNLHGDYTVTNGKYDTAGASGGTIVLMADGDQTVSNATFYNLRVAGTGNKYFAGTNTVEGTTEISSSLIAQAGSAILFKGDMTIEAMGVFNDGGQSHEFGGTNWRGNGTYTGTGTMTFNRTVGHQYLYQSTFNNLVVDCTGRVLYLQDDVDINGDLTFKSGVNHINLQTSTFTGKGLGAFTVESGVVTYVYGADNFPKGFATYNMDVTSDTRYYGSSNQNIAGVSYGILRLNNPNTKTLMGDTEVKGNLHFYQSTLDVSVNNFALTVGGHWYNNNTDGGNFVCRQGQVIFNGTDDRNIYMGDNNGNTFYDILVNGSAQISAANPTNNDFIVQNNLNVTSGVFNANGRTIYVGGDLMATGAGTFNNSTGTYYLNKAAGNANIGFNGSSLLNLVINGGASYTAQGNLALVGSFTLSSGTFNGNGHKVDLGNGSGDVVNIDGTYIVGAGGVLGLGNGVTCTVGTTGRIEVVGSTAGLAKVSNNASGGRYGFVVHGEIAAEYYMFEYMSNVGVYLTSTSTIDATHHFSNGTFSNGATTGQLLRIENTQSFTEAGGNRIEKVSFPVNPGGSAFNVAKYESTSGELEFYNSVGVFAGENFDNDPSNLIDWTGPVSLTWNGLTDSDWNKAANWTASSGSPIVPTSDNNVFVPGGLVNYPELTISGQETGNLTIEQGGKIRMSTVAGDVQPDLDVDGDLTIVGALHTTSAHDLISVEGNWTAASGARVILNGRVTFNGVGGAKQIDNGGAGFYALTISGTTQYQIARDIKVKMDLTIDAGAAFDASPSNRTITVGGDWVNSGKFIAQQGTVVLKSLPGTQSIRGGGYAFYNLQINSPGTRYNLLDDMGVDEMLQIQKGIVDVKVNTLRIGDGRGTDGVSISGTLLVNAGATLDMGDNASLNVNAGGSMELLGDDKDNRATLTSSTGGRYSFDVNSGGAIKASFYNVDYTDADGLHMHSGAHIDATYNLSDGTFSNGFPGSGSYMTLMHDMATADFTLRNLIFNAGPNHSVTRTAGTTIFHFEDASGLLGNYLYERDEEAVPSPSSGLLRWPFVKLYTWEGDVDSNWLTPGNWFDDQLPVSTSDITIPNIGQHPVIDNSQLFEMHALTIEAGATVTVQPGARLTINGDLTTNDGLIIQNTPAQPVSLIVNGTVSGQTNYEWSIPKSLEWYMSHPVRGVTEQEYEASY